MISQEPILGRSPHSDRLAFTIVELMVTVGIIAVLTAMILPAVQQARASARRITCLNNLRQVALASLNYSAVYGVLAPDIDGLYLGLAPYRDAADRIDIPSDGRFSKTIQSVEADVCPADPLCRTGRGLVSYPANVGLGRLAAEGNRGQGIICAEGRRGAGVPPSAVTDGLSNTAFFSERLIDVMRPPAYIFGNRPGDVVIADERLARLRWRYNVAEAGTHDAPSFVRACRSAPPHMIRKINNPSDNYGYLRNSTPVVYNHLDRPNSRSCRPESYDVVNDQLQIQPPRSEHAGGVNLAFADGHARFVGDHVDITVWRNLGTRSGQTLPGIDGQIDYCHGQPERGGPVRVCTAESLFGGVAGERD